MEKVGHVNVGQVHGFCVCVLFWQDVNEMNSIVMCQISYRGSISLLVNIGKLRWSFQTYRAGMTICVSIVRQHWDRQRSQEAEEPPPYQLMGKCTGMSASSPR